ncbi:hypothetical protein UK23_01685 [Lentzea aerocolonigenes]|uniref:SGNH hydrolase-type esterase domain-containing protein n=1 Tax=Lentzea aerocolonigenes TaxID=68170 RepID=A0A0F0HFJ7_LENAE|nr:hypothetical protein UK23_01685 [Lentzea aerocolonigenes]
MQPSVREADRDAKLTSAWRGSTDRAVTSDSDASGLHLLVADAATGYTWRTAATLSEPGTDTDQWIGQYCVTGSGKHAVVVYAPRAAANKEQLFHGGALAAVVDLGSGAVTKLGQPVSLAYHNPGCGSGETAVLSRLDGDESRGYATKLMTVDTEQAKITETVSAPGQLTSAVPFGGAVAAVRGTSLVSVDAKGGQSLLHMTDGAPSRLVPTGRNVLGYQVVGKDKTEIHALSAGTDAIVASAAKGDVQLRGAGGTAVLVGPSATRLGKAPLGKPLPQGWRAVDAAADAELSTAAQLVVTAASNKNEAAAGAGARSGDDGPQPVSITATAVATGAKLDFVVAPSASGPVQGSAPTPASAPQQSAVTVAADPANETTDPNRTCAIPRNDPRIQTLQPSPRMGEWAVDLAIQGKLTTGRPAGWNGTTIGAYSPQGLFPLRGLSGGGRIPAQIMLGVLAQESNMWQASPHAVDGESGNFHQGGFYGNHGDISYVNFAGADCGYGMAQVTDGMRVGMTKYTYQQQVALTVDYAANIAAGMQILESKWNELAAAGVKVNGGDPKYLENWWFALWAYNSGYHQPGEAGAGGAYGLGWTNNMANPDYPADRGVFLSDSRDDAKTPNHWSYPERVIGWAANRLQRYDYNAKKYDWAFPPAVWPHGVQGARPGLFAFCAPDRNQCDQTKPHVPAQYPQGGPTACQRDDLRCWWHDTTTWADCARDCGVERLSFSGNEPEPTITTPYPARCGRGPGAADQGLPANALVIDDVPVEVGTGCGLKGFSNSGSLSFNFGSRIQNGNQTTYPSKVDFHQVGAGFGGHFWFAHAFNNVADYAAQRVTGTWKLNQSLNQWARVLVHVTDHGAETQQATYTIRVGQADYQKRTIPQGAEQNKWVSLGVFNFSGTPEVSLNNYTDQRMTLQQQGIQDVVYDAVAFAPLPGKPKNIVVSLGDSYASGEGTGAEDNSVYYHETDVHGGTWMQNNCHRSTYSWSRLARLADSQTPIGERADNWNDTSMDHHLLACSGAWTGDVYGNQSVFAGEKGQMEAGFLNRDTTLVTLSVGGNDAKFSPVLEECVLATRCQDNTLAGDTEPLSAAEPKRIDGVMGSVATVIRKIAELAPNATIVLMGYPVFLEPDGATACNTGFTTETRHWLRDMAVHLRDRYVTTVDGLRSEFYKVRFADPIPTFTGKGACGGNPELINRVIISKTPGEDPNRFKRLVSQQSLHPNALGALHYAGVLEQTLRSIGM